MKRKTIFLIATAVAAVHAIAFYFIAGMSPLPKVRYVPPDNFSLGWAKFTDPGTHQKMVYQEFTVSTRIDPAASAAASPKP